jgi:hypothetical protein
VVHAILTESNIAEAWQGQSELDDVMRMTFADSTGTAVNLTDKAETVNLQMTVGSAWIKENMQLVVFVQDKVTREIYNGDIKRPLVIGIGEENISLQVYPNPASAWVVFPELRRAAVQVFTMEGVMVKSAGNISGKYRMDVSDLENGLYLVRVVDQNKKFHTKLQVIH